MPHFTVWKTEVQEEQLVSCRATPSPALLLPGSPSVAPAKSKDTPKPLPQLGKWPQDMTATSRQAATKGWEHLGPGWAGLEASSTGTLQAVLSRDDPTPGPWRRFGLLSGHQSCARGSGTFGTWRYHGLLSSTAALSFNLPGAHLLQVGRGGSSDHYPATQV